jgi:tol-pal system protein YbgF
MRHTLIILAFVLALAPAGALAQNREHLQMTADLRMLQEHVSRLQLAVNRIDQQLAETNKRIDSVNAASVKGFADQQLLINQLAGTLASVRERLDDNSVRVSQLGQEFSAIREGVRLLTDQINTLVSLLQPAAAPPDGSAPPSSSPAAGGTPGGTTPAAGALNPVTLPQSATRVFDLALGDYLTARYDSAIDGFREVVAKFPQSPDAARAQFFIGQAYNQKKECRNAIAEYQRFVDTYPNSPDRAEGLLMLGWCYNDVGQRTNTQRVYQQLLKEYPSSTSAIMARQRLEAMGIKPQ